MRIAYILTRADEYGGAQIHVRDLSKWMKDRGHDVTVIAGRPGIVSNAIRANGVRFIEAPSLDRSIHPLKDVFAFFQLRRILKDIDPDVVSCHSSKAGILGRMCAAFLGKKSIFTAHGWAFTEGISTKRRLVFQLIEKICRRFGDHIIAVSHFDKQIALDKGIADERDITVIHNGMPFRPAIQNETKPDNAPVKLCMVARFSPQKDHVTLLNALGMIKDHNWHLNLIGGGDDTDSRALVIALDIADKVTFHGQRQDVPDFLETQDVYLLISHWEGFPRSILEAMRANLPVITTRTAGSPEAVTQFETGYVVPEHDPFKLSRAINLLVKDALRRQAMGQKGRHHYEKHFTFDTMAEKTLSVYQNVLGTAPVRQPQKQAQESRMLAL